MHSQLVSLKVEGNLVCYHIIVITAIQDEFSRNINLKAKNSKPY